MYIAAVNKRSDATVKNKFKREATPPKMSLTRVKAFATARMCRERTVYNHRYVASAHARLNALFNSKDFGFSYVIKYTLITA
ncbi:unnamed protein product [Xylocopa violacea]|uniref:Uncharacterized protein n=1 Tax=Xylocopa violacea TaxID=135666 RepID=A0ABP1NHH6_XYLVO